MRAVRCFLAVEIPAGIARKATRVGRKLEETGAKIRLVETENLHLTTNFLGDVTTEDLVDISRAAIDVAERHSPFTLELSGCGAFPEISRARIAWIGAGQGSSPFCDLQRDLANRLADIGFPPDRTKQFHPHLTLGRIQHPTDSLIEVMSRLAEENESLGDVPVDEVVVYASTLDRTGPKYTIIGRAPLVG
ncbi:MAG: RNA 2',3'-cyclic phosphodiesterase [Pirellulaceae bacterium]